MQTTSSNPASLTNPLQFLVADLLIQAQWGTDWVNTHCQPPDLVIILHSTFFPPQDPRK